MGNKSQQRYNGIHYLGVYIKLAIIFSLALFTSLAQARFCTTSENLVCGMAPVCSSDYTVACSDGTSQKFSSVTGPLGLGKGAYPKVKKWTLEQGLMEKKINKDLFFFYDSSERPDARYCVTTLINSEKTGLGKQAELHNVYVNCFTDKSRQKLYKLVTREEVNSDLETTGYRNINTDKTAKVQYYRYAND